VNEEPRPKGWWHTVPGILTATVSIISAVTALIGALHQAGFFDRENRGLPIRKEITVLADANTWSDTGVEVHPGRRLEIIASGKINISAPEQQAESGPDGNSNFPCNFKACPGIGEPGGELYGKLGNGVPFPIGTHLRTTVDAGGRLFLKVNDHFFDDNGGSFNVIILLQ
jgi:hypothetical protein